MGEIRSLTGLRGIAALIVFLAHTRETLMGRGLELPVPLLLERLFLSGGRQVDIFFVLSGFILAMIYSDVFAESISSKSYFKFLQRRFARIYPLHFVMLILVLGFIFAARLTGASLVNGFDRFDFSTLPQHFLLVHAWGVFMNGLPLWNPPSWSISIEALAYLIFPLFVLATYRRAKSHPWILIAVICVLGFALNAYIQWGLVGVGGVVRGLTEFGLGVATMNVYKSKFASWAQSSAGSALVVAAFVVAFALVPDTGFIIAFVTAPLLLTLCADNAPSRALSWQPIYFLGEISYSIYLGHFLFSSIAYRIVKPEWMQTSSVHAVLGILFVIAFVVAIGTCTYYLIEQPGRDFLNGHRKRNKVVAQQAA